MQFIRLSAMQHLFAIGVSVASSIASADGQSVYAQRCAACHDLPVERAPSREALRAMSPEVVFAALANGAMQLQSTGMSQADRRDVSAFVTGKEFGALAEPKPNPCKRAPSSLRLASQDWNGWGRDADNSRHQPRPGIKATDVSKLQVKWAYTFPGRAATGHPTVVDGKLFVSSSTGRISMLDARSGCEYWTYETRSNVRAAITVGRLEKNTTAKFAAYFGDQKAVVYAVNAETGKPLWQVKLDDHPVARITGSPQLFAGRLYVPVSSVEEVSARTATYQCCTFRGSVVALDAETGKILWKTHTIAEAPKPFKVSSSGTRMLGPAGAAVWSTPTIDAKRGVLYIGTGNSYTDAETNGSNSVQALRLDTGATVWVHQLTPKDAYLTGCGNKAGVDNCPAADGPDFDIGSPPILRALRGGKQTNGKQMLVVGQKSGVVWGLDPEDGKTLWTTRVGRGGALGGVEWGMAADSDQVYAPNADFRSQGDSQPGLIALDIATGETKWTTPAPQVDCRWGTPCNHAQSAPATSIPGVVFSGAYDGHVRAYSEKDGAIVWDFDTARTFTTVNGLEAAGGSIEFSGVTVADGYVFVISGAGGRVQSGRVLLAFTVNGK